MKWFFLVGIFQIGIAFSQDAMYSHAEIKEKIKHVLRNSVFSDSLEYIDSTHTYLKEGVPFNGYAIHHFNYQFRFNLFKEGQYFGEEWIFYDDLKGWHKDSLINNLLEFRVRCDTNEHYTLVTSYYDFQLNCIKSVRIDYRYLHAEREATKFHAVFGSDDDGLPYKQFHENGNLYVVSVGDPFVDGESIYYHENGQKESVYWAKKEGKVIFSKVFDENGKCIGRGKMRNDKIRGLYAIIDGKVVLSVILRHQIKKKEKAKESGE